MAICIRELILAPSNSAPSWRIGGRRVTLIAIFAFTVCPFILSSNLIVKVGVMKADRIMYLPLLGLCMLEALAFQTFLCPGRIMEDFGHEEGVARNSNKKEYGSRNDKDRSTKDKDARDAGGHGHVGKDKKITGPPRLTTINESIFGLHWLGHILLLVQLGLFVAKVRERNLAWSSNFRLWQSAFEVNPRSHHTRYQYGNQLFTKGQLRQAEWVLRPIRSPKVYNPTTTFLYCDIIKEFGRCDYALPLLEEALEVLRDESKSEGQFKLFQKDRNRVESNLLAVKGRCTKEQEERFAILQQALDVDPENEYAKHSWTMRMFAK